MKKEAASSGVNTSNLDSSISDFNKSSDDVESSKKGKNTDNNGRS